mmetsp:Transcript_29218/g.58288  ORF Transcript_29218/g.58288 Transcript_29218/m.58288 type:complete len:269 (+) Transcript_29218:78-884(+)
MSTAVIKTQLIQAWQDQPAIRFATSGIIGNGIFFGLDTLLYPLIVGAAKELVTSTASASPSSKRRVLGSVAKWLGENAASVSFFVAYLLDIFVQHFLNAWLVFGLDTIRTRKLYLSSLTSAYTAYFGTLCGSTILQAYLIQLGLSKSIAFWITIGLGSVINYTVLTALEKRSETKTKSTNEISMILKMDQTSKSTNTAFAAGGKANVVTPRRKKTPPISMIYSLKKRQLHDKHCCGDEEVDLIQQFSIRRHLISTFTATFRSNTQFIV